MANNLDLRGASQSAIEEHYDLGVAFWNILLGRSMVYSCGSFTSEEASLDEAQYRKIDIHLHNLGDIRGGYILDVGCGWGSLAVRALEKHDVDLVDALTLSTEQREYVESLNESSLNVRLESWDEFAPNRSYDGIVSVGAFEHFASPDHSKEQRHEIYRLFFDKCSRWLKPGGALSLQSIVLARMNRDSQSSFINETIYPESELPSFTDILTTSCDRFDFLSATNTPQEYERTLQLWLARFRSNRSTIAGLLGENKFRDFERYLRMSIYAFKSRNLGLVRVLLRAR